jgi:hypothetical protein
MKVFTIENETNNITVDAHVEAAEAMANANRFRNEAGLEKIAADWLMARLVEIWNSLPGVTPVTKFKDRKTGVSRIWKQIQNLSVPEQQPTQHPEPEAQAEIPSDQISAMAEPLPTEQVAQSEMPATDAIDLVSADAMLASETGSSVPEPELTTDATETATGVAPQPPDIPPAEVAVNKKATRVTKTPAEPKTGPGPRARPLRLSRCSSAKAGHPLKRLWPPCSGRSIRHAQC